jgi:hypothetical protein
MKLTTHLHVVAKLRMSGEILLLPLYEIVGFLKVGATQ